MRRSVGPEKALIDWRGKPLLAIIFGSTFLSFTIFCVLSLIVALIISTTVSAYLVWDSRSNHVTMVSTNAAPIESLREM